MRALTTCAAALQFALAACGSIAPTQVAIKNGGNASIDAAISDGQMELVFDSVAAGSTASFKLVNFKSLSALKVKVDSHTSSVDLREGMLNVVAIGADGKVTGVMATGPAADRGTW